MSMLIWDIIAAFWPTDECPQPLGLLWELEADFSSISWYFAKIDPLRWTSYMDECLQVLLEKSEAPSDEIFAHQVRLHLVAEKATQLSSKDTDHEYHQVSGTSMPFYLRAFNSQLSQIKSDYSLAAQRSRKQNYAITRGLLTPLRDTSLVHALHGIMRQRTCNLRGTPYIEYDWL